MVVSLALLALTACTNTVTGQPGATSASNTGSPTAASGNATDPFAELDLCTLVDQGVADQGFSSAKPSGDVKSVRQCVASKPGFATVGLIVQAGNPYNSNFPDGVTTKTGDVNGRPSVQSTGGTYNKFGCDIYLEVKPNSRAIVGSTMSAGTAEEACTLSGQVATKIEPLLPKNN